MNIKDDKSSIIETKNLKIFIPTNKIYSKTNIKIEGIEMMRALENNMKIGTFELKGNSFSVDTAGDYFKAREYMIKDKWRKKY